MLKKYMSVFVLALGLVLPTFANAQEPKVVPIGDTIKPEAAPKAKKKRRKYRAVVVKPGKTFLVELGTALSSGLTKEGEIITIRAAENVGSSRRPGIVQSALGRGTVSEVDKKRKRLVVRLDSINSYNGTPIPISGEINLQGDGGAAAANVGERFTATVQEKIVVRSRPRKPKPEPKALTAFIEITGKGAQADLKRGRAKGKVKMVLEAPKGYDASDIETASVALRAVNGKRLAQPVYATAGKAKEGDANRNGTTDWTLYFGTWNFVKDQPEGLNLITVRGQLNSGQIFEAVTRVKVDY